MTELYCPQPFINKVVNGLSKRTQPCCVMTNWPPGDSTEVWEKLKREFVTGEGNLKEKFCESCIVQEKHSDTSPRKSYLQKYEKNPSTKSLEYNAPSNFCNLKCHMCGPWNSSTYAKENQKISSLDSFGQRFSQKYGNKTLIQENDDYNWFEPENITELKLVGGETLAIKNNYDVMMKAIDSGHSKNISLTITTNATLTPKFNGLDIFEIIPNFKSCKINISIEGWGKRNNYFRFPSNWDDIILNAKRFMGCADTQFDTTINALNIGYLSEVVEGAKNLGCTYNIGSLVWGSKEWYTVEAIPPDIRELYLDKFYSLHDTELQHLISYLEDTNFDEQLLIKMIRDVKSRDIYRGTCLLDIAPEWKPYYE